MTGLVKIINAITWCMLAALTTPILCAWFAAVIIDDARAAVIKLLTSRRIRFSPLSIALSILSIPSTALAATVTGYFTDAFQQPITNAIVRFAPRSNPQAANPSILSAQARTTRTSTNGAFSVALAQGNYTVTLDGTIADAFTIAVPADTNTYNITALTAPGITYTYTNPPSSYPLLSHGDILTNLLPYALKLAAGSGITLTTNAGTLSIASSASGSGGETNTASNIGTSTANAVGVYQGKSGVDLQFRSLVPGNLVALSTNATNITLHSASIGSSSGFGTNTTLRGSVTLDGDTTGNNPVQLLSTLDVLGLTTLASTRFSASATFLAGLTTTNAILAGADRGSYGTNTSTATIYCDMLGHSTQFIAATNNITLETTNRPTAGTERRDILVWLRASGADRTITLNSTWVILATNTFTLTSNKWAAITISAYGPNNTDVFVTHQPQP